MLLQAHPTGNSVVRNLAEALVEGGLLSEFWTCLDYPTDDRWLRALPTSWLKEGQRRRISESVKPFTRLQSSRELGRLFSTRLGLGRWTQHETSPLSVEGVYRALDRRVAKRLRQTSKIKGLYLYEDGAEHAFTVARSLGIKNFYDLPIGYWRAARRILGEEAERSPEWAATLKGNQDSEAKLARKDRELALADTVFVASSFTRSTLSESATPPSDVVLLPFGSPAVDQAIRPAIRAPGEPLRVIFVGSLGQRKGLSYLLDAMDQLGSGFELTLIGTVPAARCDPLAAALSRHRHIASLPHAGILAEMRRHHVFVFPSLFEGFGLVLPEAMACGLPIIATPHTAAPDLITEGKEGFIVPIRSSEAIARRLAELADDEDRRQTMAAQALQLARDLTWESYRRNLITQVSLRLNA